MMILAPSPRPPYHRPVRVDDEQWLTGDGDIDLTVAATYLDSTTKQDGNLPYEVEIPTGLFQRQVKQIILPKKNEMDTASFVVRGMFVDHAALWFGPGAASAVLEWDGGSWHVLGGSAIEEVDATFPPGAVDQDGGWVRIRNGVLQLKSPDNLLWYDAFPRLAGGAVSLSLEGEGSAT